jgi:predicted pyridoxine 5'-phosphate oxidase superfamily flavin-nucleotide-binding protein
MFRRRAIRRVLSKSSTSIRSRYRIEWEITAATPFLNVLENPSVGLLFIVPKRREVVRVSGVAQVVRDPELLKRMAVNGKLPELALLVRVREAFFHCGKSMIRSGMWEPDRWGSIDGLPTYAQALKDHANLSAPLSDIERGVASNETDRLY